MNTALEQRQPFAIDALSKGFNTVSFAPPVQETYKKPELTEDELLLLAKSGFINDPNHTRFSVKTDDEKEETERKRKEENILREGFFGSSVNAVVDAIDQSITFDTKLQNMFLTEVSEKDMLKGPDGKPVQTLEEKRQLEEQGRDCKAHYVPEEIVRDPNSGKMITRLDFEGNMRIQERMEYKTTIRAKLQNGEIKPDDVPADIRKELTEREQTKLTGTDPTFHDRLKANYNGFAPLPPITSLTTKIEMPPQPVYNPAPSSLTPSM